MMPMCLISSAKLQRQYQNHPILKISYARLYLSKMKILSVLAPYLLIEE